MKTIGLLGGMSWESTVEYYRLINQGVNERLGGLHSAKIVMVSVDFDEVERLQHASDWEDAGKLLTEGAQRIEKAGADFLVICTNTMHKLAEEIADGIGIPLLHIADATAEAITSAGMKRVGLLGTTFTMAQEFYRGHLTARYGIDVVIPKGADRGIIHNIIYRELCVGKTREQSKQEFIRVMDELARRGAQGIVLGCTEIPLLVKPADARVPLFDTTAIHAAKAVEWALAGED